MTERTCLPCPVSWLSHSRWYHSAQPAHYQLNDLSCQKHQTKYIIYYTTDAKFYHLTTKQNFASVTSNTIQHNIITIISTKPGSMIVGKLGIADCMLQPSCWRSTFASSEQEESRHGYYRPREEQL